jgi:DNA-directed RNA polymerase II subunit RPB1
MSIDRYGINKNDIGPLAKMSFEQTEDIALRAAIFGERDPILGVSAKVMLGAPIKAGTGFSELLFDEEAAIKFAESTPEQHSQPTGSMQRFPEGEEDEQYDDNGECSAANIQLNVAIPEATLETVEETEEDVNIVTLD